MKKAAIMIPISGRREVTLETISMYKQQTMPVEIVIVGSDPCDREVAEMTNSIYIEYPNKFLGEKWQAGVMKARELEPDILVIAGSDEWHSYNWCEYFAKKIEEGHVCGGAISCFFLRCERKLPLELHRMSLYKGGGRYGEPHGPGRVVSKECLDTIDWQLYTGLGPPSLDGRSIKRLAEVGKCFGYDDPKDEVILLSLKGDWKTIDTYDNVIKHCGQPEKIADPEGWLNKVWPDALVAVRRLRNE